MTPQVKKIVGWLGTGLLVLLLAASAIDKISGSSHALHMGASFGLSAGTYRLLGFVELASVLLFAWPRTGVPGTLLLASYLGGAIATHLQHQQGLTFPAALEAAVWLVALIRFPELGQRLAVHPEAAASPRAS